jgi:hypothetical protein
MPFSLTVDLLYPLKKLIPRALRTPVRVAYIKQLASDLQTLNTELVAAYNARVTALQPTGQIIQLERILNITFAGGWNPTAPGYLPPIRISNSSISGLFYLPENDAAVPYLLPENNAGSPLLLPENTPPTVAGFSFLVYIPVGASYNNPTDIARIRTLVSAYSIVGRTFNVVTY